MHRFHKDYSVQEKYFMNLPAEICGLDFFVSPGNNKNGQHTYQNKVIAEIQESKNYSHTVPLSG